MRLRLLQHLLCSSRPSPRKAPAASTGRCQSAPVAQSTREPCGRGDKEARDDTAVARPDRASHLLDGRQVHGLRHSQLGASKWRGARAALVTNRWGAGVRREGVPKTDPPLVSQGAAGRSRTFGPASNIIGPPTRGGPVGRGAPPGARSAAYGCRSFCRPNIALLEHQPRRRTGGGETPGGLQATQQSPPSSHRPVSTHCSASSTHSCRRSRTPYNQNKTNE